jgi:hypothetical protein
MASTTATLTGLVECHGPLRTPSRSRSVGGSSTRRQMTHVTRTLRHSLNSRHAQPTTPTDSPQAPASDNVLAKRGWRSLIRTTWTPSSETVALVSRSLRRRFSITPSEVFLTLRAHYSLAYQPSHILKQSSLASLVSEVRKARIGLSYCAAALCLSGPVDESSAAPGDAGRLRQSLQPQHRHNAEGRPQGQERESPPPPEGIF